MKKITKKNTRASRKAKAAKTERRAMKQEPVKSTANTMIFDRIYNTAARCRAHLDASAAFFSKLLPLQKSKIDKDCTSDCHKATTYAIVACEALQKALPKPSTVFVPAEVKIERQDEITGFAKFNFEVLRRESSNFDKLTMPEGKPGDDLFNKAVSMTRAITTNYEGLAKSIHNLLNILELPENQPNLTPEKRKAERIVRLEKWYNTRIPELEKQLNEGERNLSEGRALLKRWQSELTGLRQPDLFD